MTMTYWKKTSCFLPAIGTLLAGCGATEYEFDTDLHLTKEKVSEEKPVSPASVPDLVGSTAEIPQLEYEGTADVYDIVVDLVSVRQVLSSLADQSQLDIDIDVGVEGIITLNAYGQTIAQILERIRKQLPLRYERIGNTLVVLNDEAYYKQYTMEFPDLTRSYTASTDGTVSTGGTTSLGDSSISISKEGSGSVWDDLEEALEVLLEQGYYEFEVDDVGVAISDDEALIRSAANATQLLNRAGERIESEPFAHFLPDAGLIIVYATSEQHKLIQEVIYKVTEASRRQVLLQATVVEIALNNTYQQGIDWSIFNGNRPDAPSIIQSITGNAAPALTGRSIESVIALRDQLEEANRFDDLRAAADAATAAATEAGRGLTPTEQAAVNQFNSVDSSISRRVSNYGARGFARSGASGGFLNSTFTVGDVQAAVSLLDKFGDTRVVSSPRISTLNGQGAILKVVEDQIYFSTETETEFDQDANTISESITVEENTIPVGFVVNVYPQIGGDGTIILAMRPSVSRVIGVALAPTVGNPEISNTGVPIVSVKEIETLMLLQDGQTAVMGGLIEDQNLDDTTGVPGLNKVPGIGGLFENKNETTRRVEYIIFVSAKIIKNPTLYGDFSDYQKLLPSDETFHRDQTNSFLTGETSKVNRSK